MAVNFQNKSQSLNVIRWCTIMSLLFVLCIFLLPQSASIAKSNNLTISQYRYAQLLVNIPIISVWYFAFWGYSKLKEYSKAIIKTPEGKSIDKLASGITWLAWSLPVVAITNKILTAIGGKKISINSFTIILSNYIDLVLPLVAFIIISSAARKLIGDKKASLDTTRNRLLIILFALIGVVYCFLILRAFDLSSLASTKNPYHLPAWLMIVSIIIPYLYAWFIGLLAAYEILIYSKHLHGLLYKNAMYFLACGLVAIIISYIAGQYLSSVWHMPKHLEFSLKQIIIILFKIVGGIGYIFLAYGASKLKKIEEV